jgi:phenylpropionate dioxygenase-like ring-hydroxylating dioxygenase large terminal subunit
MDGDGQLAFARRNIDDADVVRLLAHHVEQRSTDLGADSVLISPDVYTDPKRWEAERREVFLKLPLLACLTRDIPSPGDSFLFDEAGPSILIIRAKDGSVNAFLNMCTHRGVKLVKECGHYARLTCPFHGWTFNSEGKLIGAPRREAFDAGLMENRDLVRVPVGEWRGMIFIKAQPGDEEIDVEGYLGSFAETMASLNLDLANPVRSGRLDFQGNWKYALDTYGEGYHISVLHAKSVGSNYYGDLIAVQRHGKHCRISFAPNSFSDTIGKPEHEWPVLDYAPAYHIFPNIVISFQPRSGGRAFLSLHKLFPGKTVDEGLAVMTTYKAGGPISDEDRHEFDFAHESVMELVRTEDFGILSHACNNLRYAPKDFKSIFGRHEHPAATTQRNIAAACGMPF